MLYETVFVGNLSKEEAIEVNLEMQKFFNAFRKGQELSLFPIEKIRLEWITDLALSTKLSTEKSNLGVRTHPIFKIKSPVEKSDVTAISYFLKLETPPGSKSKTNILSNCIQELLGEEFYNVLRTKHQLGYVCHTSLTNMRGHTHMHCCI